MNKNHYMLYIMALSVISSAIHTSAQNTTKTTQPECAVQALTVKQLAKVPYAQVTQAGSGPSAHPRTPVVGSRVAEVNGNCNWCSNCC